MFGNKYMKGFTLSAQPFRNLFAQLGQKEGVNLRLSNAGYMLKA